MCFDLIVKYLFYICFIFVLSECLYVHTARIGILHTVLHVTVPCNTPIDAQYKKKFFIQNGVPTYRVHRNSLSHHPDKLSCDHGRELDQGLEGNTRTRR